MVFKHKDPCSTLTQAEYIAACGDGHIFACQATGDILYASSATVLSKLAKGAENTVLNMGGSNIPAWTATPTLTSITVSGAASSTITSTNDAACAIYLRTNAGTSETIKIHADQGTSESSIQLLSDDGGVNIDAATGKDVDIAGGTINLTSSDDAGSAVYIRANAGTSETIKIHADQGNGEGSIELTSDAGGIDLNAAAGKDIALDSGQVLITATHDTACTIYLHANGGTSETINLHADQGTGEGSIVLTSDAGGIDLNAAATKDIALDSGQVLVTATHNTACTIYLHANGGTSETIKIHADQGTAEGSITILSDAGGIDVNAATGKDIDVAGGTINLTSSDDAGSAIYLRANAGTSETIKIHADQGNGAASICLTSDAGGITLTPSSAVTVSGALTVGVCGTGHDVKFFGDTAGAYMLYDQSEDQLEIRGAAADATTSTGKLLLSTALTDINANDVIGSISFQAPLETGTDAVKVSASITAVAQGTFAANVNATDLIFYTAHDNCVAERFRFTSQNEIGIAGANYGNDGQVLTSGGAGAAVAWECAGSADVSVRVYTSGAQSISNACDNLVLWTAESYDDCAMHGTNASQCATDASSKLTAKTAGKYHISAGFEFASNATGFRGAYIQEGGDTTLAQVTQTSVCGTGKPKVNLSTDYDLNACEYLQLKVAQNSGGSLNLNNGAGVTWFAMHKID
jgi:hypothetical protein